MANAVTSIGLYWMWLSISSRNGTEACRKVLKDAGYDRKLPRDQPRRRSGSGYHHTLLKFRCLLEDKTSAPPSSTPRVRQKTKTGSAAPACTRPRKATRDISERKLTLELIETAAPSTPSSSLHRTFSRSRKPPDFSTAGNPSACRCRLRGSGEASGGSES